MNDITKELQYITANPFKRKGKKELEKNRFIFSLSIDQNWFKTDVAKQIMEIAIDQNLLLDQGETIKANYDLNQIELTLDYKPDNEIIHKIKEINKSPQPQQPETNLLKNLKIPKKQKEKEIEKVIKEMKGFIDRETATLIVARKHGIKIDKEIEKTLRKTLTK
ncbi:DUF2240 family protein [Methanonatronarchaeum sp. AMET-Sl]|uniref:DUF2240 family protein n=1 Tax=Methanonatronarchaeum sp. AMET-Sl TaxID=3037654 RepID=UPI00244DAD1F|nr:DUF2240 family protein [Methanonatronarchaeum sp. AMET-Sl]WGI16747.1 DUF2240 family protein [Methanonatronarchaeum sp. AMET-Sl]